jgi:hypothetical protein
MYITNIHIIISPIEIQSVIPKFQIITPGIKILGHNPFHGGMGQITGSGHGYGPNRDATDIAERSGKLNETDS